MPRRRRSRPPLHLHHRSLRRHLRVIGVRVLGTGGPVGVSDHRWRRRRRRRSVIGGAVGVIGGVSLACDRRLCPRRRFGSGRRLHRSCRWLSGGRVTRPVVVRRPVDETAAAAVSPCSSSAATATVASASSAWSSVAVGSASWPGLSLWVSSAMFRSSRSGLVTWCRPDRGISAQPPRRNVLPLTGRKRIVAPLDSGRQAILGELPVVGESGESCDRPWGRRHGRGQCRQGGGQGPCRPPETRIGGHDMVAPGRAGGSADPRIRSHHPGRRPGSGAAAAGSGTPSWLAADQRGRR